MLVGLPLAAVFLLIAWVVLTRLIYPPEIDQISGGRELIRGELREMGPTSRGGEGGAHRVRAHGAGLDHPASR
jgi:sodium-dependent dicarboxylate transporter 2/3/5